MHTVNFIHTMSIIQELAQDAYKLIHCIFFFSSIYSDKNPEPKLLKDETTKKKKKNETYMFFFYNLYLPPKLTRHFLKKIEEKKYKHFIISSSLSPEV